MSQTLAWMWLPSPGLEPGETGTVCPGHSSRTSGLPEALSLGPLQVICRQQPRAKQVKTSARPLSTVQPTHQTPTMRRSLSTGPTTGPPKVPPPSTRETGPEPCYLHQGHRGLGQTVATPSHNNAFTQQTCTEGSHGPSGETGKQTRAGPCPCRQDTGPNWRGR